MNPTKIVFTHPLVGNSLEIFKAFEQREDVRIEPLLKEGKSHSSRLVEKLLFKLKIPMDPYRINRKLLEHDFSSVDILFVVKGNEIHPWTLRRLKAKYPHLTMINWSLDDMYAWHNRSLFYSFSLDRYDLVVTTKSYNVEELKSMGAKKVLFTYQAYSKDIHKPQHCDGTFDHDIVFIGYPEKERYASILYLADHGFRVDIYGYPSAWKKRPFCTKHPNIVIHPRGLYGEEYAKALSCAKISLCFLRKINRDQHTSRSIEIPACGGFMLAERTKEHMELFEENEEAVFFETDEELLKKVRYFLKNEKERKQIAEAGLKRCMESDYSYDHMVDKILDAVNR